MSARLAISIVCATLTLASLPAYVEGQSAMSAAPGPSESDIRERTKLLTDNQHKDDEALEQFEHIDHYIDRTSGASPRTIEDRTYRVVPHGVGTMKILVKNGDTPVSPAEYRRQLLLWEGVLETMTRPDDPKAKSYLEKYEKRKGERQHFVDAAGEAFLVKWVGAETKNGHPCDVFELNANPQFHPHSMFEEALLHVMAKVWVDQHQTQIVRGEVHILSDISFGAGILGKLYKDGSVVMEQEEVAPGIWLPTRYGYDFAGRKFLFSFEEHQAIEASHYRKVGSPQDALALVKSELASGKPFSGDP